MANLIGLKELRERVDVYIGQIKRGKSFLVVRRSEPVFRISPPDEGDADLWETVVDFTQFYQNGIPARTLLKKLRSLNGGS